MKTSASEMTGAKRINSTLTFSNTASPRIEEESLKNVFSKIIEESNSSERMNLTNSAIIEPPKLVSFGHLPMETGNVGNRIDGLVATRIEDSNRI